MKFTQLMQLKSDGYTVLPGVFKYSQIELARNTVLENVHLMKNTRPTRSSRHLAGFHRYPQLEFLHCMISSHPDILAFMREVMVDMDVVTIGLTDITINRSQQWHCDLLRGSFSKYLNEEACWGAHGGGVYKALFYLQDGESLAVIPASHLSKVSLDNDLFAIPQDADTVVNVPVKAGDVVIIDIRLIHRGSTEEDMQALEFSNISKILISTVFGGTAYSLTHDMEVGNFHRLMAWLDSNQ